MDPDTCCTFVEYLGSLKLLYWTYSDIPKLHVCLCHQRCCRLAILMDHNIHVVDELFEFEIFPLTNTTRTAAYLMSGKHYAIIKH